MSLNTLRLAPTELAKAVALVQAGGVLAFPTDTVYGVGCLDAARLFEVKERPPEKRIAFLVAEPPASFTPAARALATAYWPGALTIVDGDNAYRMPNHDLALALLRQTGALPTSSANLSGHGATADPDDVWEQLAGRIDALLDGGKCPGGQESTVVTVAGEVLREGAIPGADIARAFTAQFAANEVLDANGAPGGLDARNDSGHPSAPPGHRSPQPWVRQSSSPVVETPWFRIRRDAVELPGGTVLDDYYVLEQPHFVKIFAVTDDGQAVFVRQYKHGAGEVILELPAGFIDPGEAPAAAAARELREETGYAGELRPAAEFVVNATREATREHLFLGKVHLAGAQHLDPAEEIDVVLIPMARLEGMIRSGEINTLSTVAAVLYGLPLLEVLRREPAG